MKTVFKQHLIFVSTAICLLFQIYNVKAQTAVTPSTPVVCPGVVLDYSWFASVGGCTYTWSVTNGKFQSVSGGTLNASQTQITGANLTNVKIIWDNVPASFNTSIWTAGFGSISVSTSGCVGGGSSSQNNILIKSLNGIVPDAISGSNNINLCTASPITYTTNKVRFANTGGSVYTSSIYADGYEWTIPGGWIYSDGFVSTGAARLFSNNQNANSVSVTPNNCTGGTVRVRAYSACTPGYYSNPRELPVSRPMPAVSFTAGADNVVCGKTDPITYTVTPVSCASSYTWSIPAGWSGSSTSNSITLTPNGLNAGTVGVTVNVCGQSTSVSKPVTISTIDPAAAPYISGANLICSTADQTYTINNPVGGTTTWTASSTLTIVSSTSTTITVRLYTIGYGWVQASTLTPCSTTPVVTSYNMKVGQYSSSDYPITGPSSACRNTNVYYTAPQLALATSYNWTWPSDWTYVSGQGTRALTLRTPQYGGSSNLIGVRVSNACGTGGSPATVYTSLYSCGTVAYEAYPNPADDQLEVAAIQTSSESIAVESGTEFEIALYDKFSKLRKKGKSSGGKIKINTKDLPEDTYFLHISDKEGTTRRQIVIER